MSDLVEFLLARLDEDHERGTGDAEFSNIDAVAEYGRRLVADVEAKRRIVAECRGNSRMELVGALSDLVLALLAEPYAGHPDYRDEWRVLR